MATITVSDQTRSLFDAEMSRAGIADADQMLQLALRSLHGTRGEDYEDLDDDTRAAIEAAEAEHQQGLGRPLSEVRAELEAEFGVVAGRP